MTYLSISGHLIRKSLHFLKHLNDDSGVSAPNKVIIQWNPFLLNVCKHPKTSVRKTHRKRPLPESIFNTVCFCHVTYVFQSESTLYSCLNLKEILARYRCEIWSLSDFSWIRTRNHLVHKRTLNHLAKWLSVRLWTKWLRVRIQLKSLKLQISHLYRARISFKFRQL